MRTCTVVVQVDKGLGWGRTRLVPGSSPGRAKFSDLMGAPSPMPGEPGLSGVRNTFWVPSFAFCVFWHLTLLLALSQWQLAIAFLSPIREALGYGQGIGGADLASTRAM